MLLGRTGLGKMTSCHVRTVVIHTSNYHHNFGMADCSKRQRLQVLNSIQERSTENHLSAMEFFESFLRARRSNSDFVSKASDMLWRKEVLDVNDEDLTQIRERLAELQKIREEDGTGGFLKLSQAKRWELGVEGAPSNLKPVADEILASRDDRRRAGFLEYEALKRELLLLTLGIAAVCTIYCAVTFSFEASLSYSIGAAGSLLYLRLLFRHADEISENSIAEVFLGQRKKKKGIRSADIKEAFDKVVSGSALAFSSPRLVVPAALFGLWTLGHRLTDNDNAQFTLQLAPLILGFFAYKGALLVQAFRENKSLAMSFPKDE